MSTSGVTTRQREYGEYTEKWQRCRDTAGGTDAVKRRGTEYLPALEGMSLLSGLDGDAYEAYKKRALFYPAMPRTITGLIGLCFAHPITVNVPERMRDEMLDVTLTGTTLSGFGMSLARELWTVGRVGFLLDMPNMPGGRPYWMKYTTESIINYRVVRTNGVMTLTLLVLEEDIETQEDEFSSKVEKQYRVLQLVEGRCTVSLWRKVETGEFLPGSLDEKGIWIAGAAPYVPIRRGAPLPFIPFVGMTAQGLGLGFEDPPLLALADVNLSHYRTSADHEHGAHWTALPTPWVAGHDLKGERLVIGSGTAWVFPKSDTHVGMLEYTGKGLDTLKDLKEEKRLLMVTLGARMLETQKNAAEAAATVRLRHAGETSTLSTIAGTLSDALTKGVQYHLWWSGLDDVKDGKVELSPDIMDELTSQDVAALVSAWQAGAISHKTLYENMQWGEWTRTGVDFEEEKKDIEDEGGGALGAKPLLEPPDEDE